MNREDIINFINDTLIESGFTKNPETEFWTIEKDLQTGMRTVVINGKRVDNAGNTKHVKVCIEITGEGELKDIATNKIDPFIEMDIYSMENNLKEDITPTICLYYDDQEEFTSIINQFF